MLIFMIGNSLVMIIMIGAMITLFLMMLHLILMLCSLLVPLLIIVDAKVVARKLGSKCKGDKTCIWVPKTVVTNLVGPNKSWVPKTQA
jgi:hypothetical protein